MPQRQHAIFIVGLASSVNTCLASSCAMHQRSVIVTIRTLHVSSTVAIFLELTLKHIVVLRTCPFHLTCSLSYVRVLRR